MDTALKLQLDVKNNAQELYNYMLDLSNWEEEMKRKEIALSNEKPEETIIPPPRNKIKRSKFESAEKVLNKPKKISGYDYSAWDKFDVDKACAEIDAEDNKKDNKKPQKTEESIQNEEEEEEEEEGGGEDEENGGGGDNNSNNSNHKTNFSLIDEAFYEKEMGNNFVKKEQWNDAIKCYSNAINLDAKNAIYYANRSLCFLKLKNFKSAETDATTAIQLDHKYVKAYQRRAFARLALGQLAEAKSDYEKILEIEPKNALARSEIVKIDQKLNKIIKMPKTTEEKIFNPKNMFRCDEKKTETNNFINSSNNQSGGSKTVESAKQQQAFSSNINDCSKKEAAVVKNIHSSKNKTSLEPVPCSSKTDVTCNTENKSTPVNAKSKRSFEKKDGVEVVPNLVRPISKVFKPLPEWCKVFHPVNIPPHKRSNKPFKRIDLKLVEKDDDFDALEIENESKCEVVLEEENKIVNRYNEDEKLSNEILCFNIPKTAIQFFNSWKVLKKDPEKCYSYLKKISGKDLPVIFENSLESDFFSELVVFLANDEIKKEPEVIYDYLLGLSNVKRFSSLILFMSQTDRKCVEKCILELGKVKSEEEILQLLRLYELKV